ncbi:MAG: FtsX-like permease family protein, partial [Planctomycetes bacterium]|nr:FtsX-like permease family protein [Planctomycetota bacterium]
MRALHRKLLRDLWHVKGQALAIVMVMASGVALYVSQLSTLDSLRRTRDTYYDDYRFADVFAACKRAPDSVADQVAEIPGVALVQTRIVAGVSLDVPGLPEPAMAALVGLPEQGRPALNDVFLRRGRLPEGPGEVLAGEAFVIAHNMQPGERIAAVLNGRRREFVVVGVGLSPEYVYSLPPGAVLPDDKRFGVFWLPETELAAAFDMAGAFNDVSLALDPGASPDEVVRRLDDVLAPWGGAGAVARKDQVSNWFLQNEFNQLETFGTMVPLVFIGVAAFLLNVVLGRLIATQREQIAALKAFGYSNSQVGRHYALFVIVLVLAGAAVGSGIGAWLGYLLTGVYTDFYHFPVLHYVLQPRQPLTAAFITGVACLLGAFGSVRSAANLPPAEAMRPPAPPAYRPTLVERLGLQRFLAQPSRMILRQLERRFYKAALSVGAIALAVAIVVWGRAFVDSVYFVLNTQEYDVYRQDVTVSFFEPRPRESLHDLRSAPGVLAAEPFRSVGVRLRAGHRKRLASITGVPDDVTLNRVLDAELRPVKLPAEGLVLSRSLGNALGVGPGDRVTLEVLEGSRPVREAVIAGLVDDYIGMAGYMRMDALSNLLHEDSRISGVHLLVDPARQADLYRQLKATPAVSAVGVKRATMQSLRETLAQNLLISTLFNIVFGTVIAFGVVYNNARISLSERARELASLRVLGLTRGEISYILLGELAVLTVVALPLGCLLGWLLSLATVEALNT